MKSVQSCDHAQNRPLTCGKDRATSKSCQKYGH